METRKWGNTEMETSLLGFGCMRFPTLPDGSIDEEQAEKMLEMAYAAGVNYYDTAYMYHDGNSERFVGKWLDTKPRDSYYLTTKLPMGMLHSLEEAKKTFEEQREKLHKDYFDCYLLHALNEQNWKNALEWGILDFCDELLKEGKIRHLGFSFHDSYEVFEEILNYRKWDLCQIQYNYIDQEVQAGTKGYELAVKLGVPVVVMEPVKGGSLAGLPSEVIEPFTDINPTATAASIAYRWVGTHPGVVVVLSGMSSIAQTEENIKTFENFVAVDEKEEKAITEVIGKIRSRVKNDCTGCRYCMPCPAGVNIPRNFSVWNEYAMYQNKENLSWRWGGMKEEEKAKNCVKCGKCETACPQKISIRADLEKAQQELDALIQ